MWKDQQSKLVLNLRLEQLKRSGFVGLTIEDLEKVFEYIFKRKNIRKRLSAKVEMILNTSDEEIVRLLAFQAKKDAQTQTIEDFETLIKEED